ncbi:MAG: aminotransferase class I and II, partial [Fimbriimonadaceae bacterium]|nr:aminotransferase class I and II [Chitinophagales bacterium]
DEWLADDHTYDSTDEIRQAYVNYLQQRILHSEIFVKEIEHAAETII